MSLQCMNANPELARFLVEHRAFDAAPLEVVDVGARDGFEPHWPETFGGQVRLIGFEPDRAECDRINRALPPGVGRVYPYALHREGGVREFHVTAWPASCGFYEPDAAFWRRFAGQTCLHVVRTEPMPTASLSAVARAESFADIDFIKLDTEGNELDILQGAADILERSVLGLSIEVALCRHHRGQPLYSDVDLFLRPFGFELMELSVQKHARLALPNAFTPFASGRGQALAAQALYLRDPVHELEDPTVGSRWDLVRVLKMAALFDLFSLQDCAAELVQEARARGLCPPDLAGRCLDAAARSVSGRDVAYEAHMASVVIEEFPAFLASLRDTRPDLAEAVATLAAECAAGRTHQAVVMALDRLASLTDDRSDDPWRRWHRLYFTALRRYAPAAPASAEPVAAAPTAAEAGPPAGTGAPVEPGEWDLAMLARHIAAHLAGRPSQRIVGCGAGSDFVALRRSGAFEGHHVVAVLDSHRAAGDSVDGVPVMAPSELASLEHDLIVVTSARWAETLRRHALRRLEADGLRTPVV